MPSITYTPKTLQFDEVTPIDSLRVQIVTYPSGPTLDDETIPVGDSRVTVVGSHYTIQLTGSFGPTNPSIPTGTNLLAYVSGISGVDESPAVASDSFTFQYAVSAPTNVHVAS